MLQKKIAVVFMELDFLKQNIKYLLVVQFKQRLANFY